MSRIKQLVRPESQALNWKAALPVIGFALAGLVGCAQQPPAGARQDAAMSMGPMKIHAKVIETDAVADFNSCPRPVYPAVALQNKVQGTVSLGFLIGANGRVLDTTLRESSGDASLDQAARIALAKCSFKPATVNGTPIDRWTDVKYVWAAH